ncbi:MAG TPA: hypothetical protein VGI88_12720 [Verrucomicrobiae bacterium]
MNSFAVMGMRALYREEPGRASHNGGGYFRGGIGGFTDWGGALGMYCECVDSRCAGWQPAIQQVGNLRYSFR